MFTPSRYAMLLRVPTLLLLAVAALPAPASGADQPEKLKALIIDGQNNHNWKKTTPLLKAALEDSGRFTVDVATTPQDKSQWASFKPDFSQYQVVVSNYNGDEWP